MSLFSLRRIRGQALMPSKENLGRKYLLIYPKNIQWG